MSVPNQEIGWGREEILLRGISKTLERLIQVTSAYGGGGGSGVWGAITGTISNQTDLITLVNTKQGLLTLTTTGSSGAATLTGNTLNIPQYSGAGGTVTTVSVTTANGFSGSVATPTTTPVITISTSITGVIKGNGTAISAATAGTDYSVGTSALTTGIVKSTTGTGALSIAVAGTDYLTPSGSGTALTGVWQLASGGTLTGANTIIGSTTNILKGVFNSLGASVTTVTNGAGLWLANTTAAALGAQQVSPWLVLEGQGWQTGSGATSSTKWAIAALPVQGVSPSSNLVFMSSNGGGAYGAAFTLTGSGPTATTGYFFGSGASIQSPSNTITVQAQNAATTGFVYAQTQTTISINSVAWDWTQSFAPSAGAFTWKAMRFSGIINQTGTSTGATTMIDAIHTLTSTIGTHTFLNYQPAETAVTGAHYFIRNQSTTALSIFGGATPLSTLDSGGSFGANIRTISASATAAITDHTLLCDATSGNIVVTLPTASGTTRRIYYIKKIDASVNTVSFTADGGTVTLVTQYQVRGIQSNGTSYFVISN